jgi:hypothetical protein
MYESVVLSLSRSKSSGDVVVVSTIPVVVVVVVVVVLFVEDGSNFIRSLRLKSSRVNCCCGSWFAALDIPSSFFSIDDDGGFA